MLVDQEARNHEENVDADEAARQSIREGVEIHHQHHGDGPEAVDIGPVFWRRREQWSANPGSLWTANNDKLPPPFSSRSAAACHFQSRRPPKMRWSEAQNQPSNRAFRSLRNRPSETLKKGKKSLSLQRLADR